MDPALLTRRWTTLGLALCQRHLKLKDFRVTKGSQFPATFGTTTYLRHQYHHRQNLSSSSNLKIMHDGVTSSLGNGIESLLFSTTATVNSDENTVPSTSLKKKTAGLIIIGDEVLKGQVHDTNSYFICKHLYTMGVKVGRISVITDDIDVIAEEVKSFSGTYDVVITTGGLGPTHDDMTYAGVAKAFNEAMKIHPKMEALIDKWLGNRGFKREVLMRMAEIPLSSKLFFEPSLPLASFPIVVVHNVYVFPGVPQFVEKMFPRMKSILQIGDDDAFHTGVVFVNKDELSITTEINSAVEKFKASVIFGSYPVVGNLYYRTRITMEAQDAETLHEAKTYLSGLMPNGSVVDYDGDSIETATAKVYEVYDNPTSELYHVIRQSVDTLEEALDKYGVENMWICFNGGKDCTALLHLFHAVVKRKFPNRKPTEKLNSLCINADNPFPEMEKFIQDSATRYNLNLRTYNGPIQHGLRQALEDVPEIKAVLMGTRRSDPSGKDLSFFQMTDKDWPQVMRVCPLLEWKYSDLWKLLRTFTLPYCSLYDQGYTSIGNRDNTVPNQALAYNDDGGKQCFKPAYTLPDALSQEERCGRL